jgi:OOP family OmpA-OmpF porin
MNRFALAAIALLAATSRAQTQASMDIEHLRFDPSARGSLLLGNGRLLTPGEYRAAVAVQYGYLPLSSFDTRGTRAFLEDRFTAHLSGAVGLTPWLELGAQLPVVVVQRGGVLEPPPSTTGLGTPFLHLRTGGFRPPPSPFDLSFDLGVGIPVGSGTALGSSGFAIAPRVFAGETYGPFQIALSLGALIRQRFTLAPQGGARRDVVGSQLDLGAAIVSTNTDGPRGELSVRAFTSVDRPSGGPGIEALLGGRFPLDAEGRYELFALGGPGYGGTPNTPLYRAVLGVSINPPPKREERCVAGQAHRPSECPLLDLDGDGLANAQDRCPEEAEDLDRVHDEDGCLDPDNDQDGIPDTDDLCRSVPGKAENQGCPDGDRDRDGIVERLDKCREEAEDHDGFQDEDGCPEADNDGDHILDGEDACPNGAGPLEEKGCPEKDADGDKLADQRDSCLNEAGVAENNGCPAATPSLVKIAFDRLELSDKIRFVPNKDKLQERSWPLLDQIAKVASEHPEITQVRVEVHTDNVGAPENNVKVSRARAQVVVDYLLSKGVPATKVVAEGLGGAKPIVSNDTPEGKDQNRRVEVWLVRPVKAPAPAPTPEKDEGADTL